MGLLFAMIAPLIIAGVALYGVGRGVDVYDALIHGGGEGLEVLLRIVPSLIALMTAVYMLRASGALELAAQALGTQPARIAKTLSFLVGEEPILIVAAGDVKIDNAKYKSRFHQKAKMMSAEELERFTGLRFGGVCPFAMPAPVQVWLDVSLRRFAEVYPACGSANSAVRLSIPELEKLSKPMGWVDVCKGWA